MSVLSAERSFTQGMAAMADSRHAEAAECFRAAIQIEREHSVCEPSARYLSYYGLSLALDRGRALPVDIEACETAVRRDPVRPMLLLNLGRAYLLARKQTRAVICFQRGVTLAPYNDSLRREFDRLDRRGTPWIHGLGRAHVINRLAGRVRSWLGRHRSDRVR